MEMSGEVPPTRREGTQPHMPPSKLAGKRSLSLSAMDWKSEDLSHSNLIAVCLLIMAGLCLGIILYLLRAILIPFAVAVLFYYLLQPVVNALNKSVDECAQSCRPSQHRRHGHGDTNNGEDGGGRRHTMRDDLMSLIGINRSDSNFQYIPVASEHDETTSLHHHTDIPASENRALSPSQRHSGIGVPHTQPDDHTPAHDHAHAQGWWRLVGRLRCPRWLSVILAIFFALGVFVGFGMIIYVSIQSLQAQWSQYERSAEALEQQLKDWLERLHISLNNDLVPYVMDNLKDMIPTLFSTISEAVANCMLVLIFLVYLLGPEPQPMPAGVWRRIDSHVRRYIRLKTFICSVTATLVGITLWLLNVPFPGLFALLTFVLQFVPNVGPIVATLLPVPLVVLSPYLPLSSKILSVLLPVMAHFIVGYWLEPTLFGESLEIHPIVILVSLAFWSVLWGVPGMILSVPITAMLRIVCQHLDHPYARVAVSVLEGKLIQYESPDGTKASIPPSSSSTRLAPS